MSPRNMKIPERRLGIAGGGIFARSEFGDALPRHFGFEAPSPLIGNSSRMM